MSYETIMAEIQQLQAKAEQLRRSEHKTACREVRRLISLYNLTAADVGFTEMSPAVGNAKGKSSKGVKKAKAERTRRPVPVKFSDGRGNTWTGRGKSPSWVKRAIESGATLESLRIAVSDGQP